MGKKVYWGYRITDIPKVGETISITKVDIGGCSIVTYLDEKRITTIGTITEIQRIAENMSIIWTEDCGYAVYYTE